jgi:hypothetical protein
LLALRQVFDLLLDLFCSLVVWKNCLRYLNVERQNLGYEPNAGLFDSAGWLAFWGGACAAGTGRSLQSLAGAFALTAPVHLL